MSLINQMNEEELALLTNHSTVLAGEDIDELKDSDVIREFEGISLKAIIDGEETFQEFGKLIRILNLFFKYDLDLYQQLLTFLVRKYVLKCRNNSITMKGLINPVMKDIKKEIDNEGLYNYLFTGDTTNLKPEDIFRTKELLLVSTQHFEEKDFTSEVVAEGISCITSLKDIQDLIDSLAVYPFDVSYKDLVKASIDKDNAVLLDYLITKSKDRLPKSIVIPNNSFVGYTYFDYAATKGSFKCLKYLHVALKVDNLQHKTACSNAATSGSLDCLKYLHENNFPWNNDTCSNAAFNGHLECLKYAHENDCPWNTYTCMRASRGGHLDCLKYAHENDCPWNEYVCSDASRGGHLDCLKYAHENDCPWGDYSCTNAASIGRLDCLKYAHENGASWDKDTCDEAASNGHLDCLKYVYENGGASLWGEDTCSEAASNGHLDCLKYAHENGAPWGKDTCSKAALYGHLDCLKYINDNGVTC